MQLNNRWQLSPLLLERLIDELEIMRKSDADGVFTRKLVRLSSNLMDGVTDMAKLKRSSGKVMAHQFADRALYRTGVIK
jgi:hypothetical protein